MPRKGSRGRSLSASIRAGSSTIGPRATLTSHADGFMSRTGYLEEYFLLPLEQNLAVIDPPRGIHVAVGFDQLFAG